MAELALAVTRERAEPAAVARPLIGLAVDVGVERITPQLAACRLGLALDAFEHRFGALDDCLLRLFEEVWSSFEAAVTAAYDSHPVWRDQVRAAGYAAARWFRDHPLECRFAALEMLAAGPMAQVVRELRMENMVDLIDRGRECLPDPSLVGREVATGMVGAIDGLLVQELQRGAGTADSEAVVPQLMYMVVRPYLGERAALEELTMPPPPG